MYIILSHSTYDLDFFIFFIFFCFAFVTCRLSVPNCPGPKNRLAKVVSNGVKIILKL